jgi:hypothetical protein
MQNVKAVVRRERQRAALPPATGSGLYTLCFLPRATSLTQEFFFSFVQMLSSEILDIVSFHFVQNYSVRGNSKTILIVSQLRPSFKNSIFHFHSGLSKFHSRTLKLWCATSASE